MVTLYQFEISPFCDKIRRIMHYKKIPYEVVEVPLGKSRSVTKYNPIGKLPCLEHEGKFIPDSTEIAYYLEEHFPEPSIIPEDPVLKGYMHALEDWADESLYFYEMNLRFGLPHNGVRNLPRMLHVDTGFFKWLGPRVIPRGILKITATQGVGRKSLAQRLADVERHVSAVENMLNGGRPWLLGEQLTMADFSVYAEIICINDADEGKEIIDRHPAVLEWIKRLQDLTDKKS